MQITVPWFKIKTDSNFTGDIISLVTPNFNGVFRWKKKWKYKGKIIKELAAFKITLWLYAWWPSNFLIISAEIFFSNLMRVSDSCWKKFHFFFSVGLDLTTQLALLLLEWRIFTCRMNRFWFHQFSLDFTLQEPEFLIHTHGFEAIMIRTLFSKLETA